MEVAAFVLSIVAVALAAVNLALTWFQVIPDLRERTPGDGILPRSSGGDD